VIFSCPLAELSSQNARGTLIRHDWRVPEGPGKLGAQFKQAALQVQGECRISHVHCVWRTSAIRHARRMLHTWLRPMRVAERRRRFGAAVVSVGQGCRWPDRELGWLAGVSQI